MSGAIATAYVKLIPTFDKKLTSTIATQLGQVDGKSAGSKVGKLFSRGVDSGMSGLKTSMTSRFSAATVAVGSVVAKAFTAVASAVGNSLDSAVKRVDTINNFPRIMEGMGIGADASSAAIKRLSDGIDGLPTALDDAVSGVSRFTAKNGDIDKSTGYFLAVNNAIASGGQSMEIQSSALEQLSQSYSKGKMDMMEWRSLQQAMPAQLNQIAGAMGLTADALGEGLRSGSVSMDAFMDKIVELNAEGADGLDSFEQQARKATGGIGTAMTNVQNRVNKAVAGIVDAIGQDNIAGAINAFSSQFGKIGSIIGGTNAEGKVVGLVAGLKDGLAKAFDGWEPKFNIDWGGVFGGAIEAAQSFGEFLSGPIATVIETVDGRMAHLRDVAKAAFNRLDLPEIDWNAVADGVSSVAEGLVNLSFDALATAVSTLADVGSRLKDVFGPFLEKIGPGLESLGKGASDFFEPIADFVAGVGPSFDDMMERIHGHIDDMAPALDYFSGAFNKLMEDMRPIAETVGPVVAEVLGQIGSALFGVGTIAINAAGFVLQIVDAGVLLVEYFARVPGEIAAFFESFPETVGSFFAGACLAAQGAFESLVDFASSIPGRIVDFFAGLGEKIISAIGSIVLPISAPSTIDVGGQSVQIPSPTFASGGIVSHPAFTSVGLVGEAGAEAIIPLTNRRYVRPFARAVAGEMTYSGQAAPQVTNIYIDGVQALPDSRIYDVSYELATTILDQRRA